MTSHADFAPEQVVDAIGAALPANQNVGLSASEAAEQAATYRGNLAHYRHHFQKSLDEGDYLQAAEKSWGAFTQAVKVIAADRQYHVPSHTAILRVSQRLSRLAAQSDPEAAATLSNGSVAAHSLHSHFYENNLPEELVVEASESVTTAIDLLQELFPPEPNAQ